VKVGADAANIGICDVWWTSKAEMRSSTTILPATEFPAHPEAAAFAKSIDDFLEETKVFSKDRERERTSAGSRLV
jgi:hypothetical protein